MPGAKILDLPNGYRTFSDRITRVNVFPDRSLSLRLVFVEIWEAERIVYCGIVDLDRVVAAVRFPAPGRVEPDRAAATV